MKIALLQPLIPEYRETLFKALQHNYSIDFFVYQGLEQIEKQEMGKSSIQAQVITSFSFLNIIIFYAFTSLLKKEYKILILPAEIRSISTWLLLILKKVLKKKIIIWGHGISVKNYLAEEKKYPIIKKIFHNLADNIWLYTDKEKAILARYINKDKIIALHNTIDIKPILSLDYNILKIKELKNKYNINTKINFIFSARFTTPLRRPDLLIDIIKSLDKIKYGFIIIGDGKYKPNFNKFKNVYDFGSVYDRKLKNELFSIADIYIQPAWLGLSAAEALAYGKPVFTFKRTDEIKQCVEYDYVKHLKNGYKADNINDLVGFIKNLNSQDINNLQVNAREFAKNNLNINNMILHATTSINNLLR